MRKIASLIAVAFLAVFAASTVVHAVSANAMALDMAMADGGAMSMPDCQGCPEDGGSDASANGRAAICSTSATATAHVSSSVRTARSATPNASSAITAFRSITSASQNHALGRYPPVR